MKRSAGLIAGLALLASFAVSLRADDAVNCFGEGEVEAIVQTSVGVKCELVGSRKELVVDMPLKRKMSQLFEYGLPFVSRQLGASNFLGDHVADFQRHQSRDMKSIMRAVQVER